MKLDVKLNKSYNYFDDDKIQENRKMTVKITDIIPFKKIDSKTLELWKHEVEDCDWLYAKETDYFVKGKLQIREYQVEDIIFVRTINDGWFSIGLWSGRLDVYSNLAHS